MEGKSIGSEAPQKRKKEKKKGSSKGVLMI
jgi:hypothetical protein